MFSKVKRFQMGGFQPSDNSLTTFEKGITLNDTLRYSRWKSTWNPGWFSSHFFDTRPTLVVTCLHFSVLSAKIHHIFKSIFVFCFLGRTVSTNNKTKPINLYVANLSFQLHLILFKYRLFPICEKPINCYVHIEYNCIAYFCKVPYKLSLFLITIFMCASVG